ncbi:MAG TPA: hypothetical protein VLF18_02725 [Tahibacter sp.]|uniref:DUF6959 family protein n=1 Tax=Tahibacter sp. TaxID=2056211 RepID=UPI002BE66B41|nr:hypothetical protein [Tahibacter sp.]HSX59092.1 hypothetical protein [Tahibacter sp.]
MKLVEFEIYSEASNCAVVRVPGRPFPDCVVQGDSLSSLFADSKELSLRLQELGVTDENVLSLAQALQEQLLDRLVHYQRVMAVEGLALPYSTPVSERDLVALVSE